MKYVVSVAIDGRIDVEVEASSFDEARHLADAAVREVDPLFIEFVRWNAVNAEREDGEFRDY